MIFVDVTNECIWTNGWVRYKPYSIMVYYNGSVIWDFFCADRLERKYNQILYVNAIEYFFTMDP